MGEALALFNFWGVSWVLWLLAASALAAGLLGGSLAIFRWLVKFN